MTRETPVPRSVNSMIHWSVEPLIPTSLWLALAILAAVLIVVYAMRKPAIVTRRRWMAILSLMSIAISLVLALLLNPIRIEDIPPPAGKPLLTVLVDCDGKHEHARCRRGHALPGGSQGRQ